jgi:hypothetical protein
MNKSLIVFFFSLFNITCHPSDQIFDPFTNIEYFSKDACISFLAPEKAKIEYIENNNISIFYMRWGAYIDLLENEDTNENIEIIYKNIYKSASKSTKDLKFENYEIFLNQRNEKELFFFHSRIYDDTRTSGSSLITKFRSNYYHIFSELFYPEKIHPTFVEYYLEWPKKVKINCN